MAVDDVNPGLLLQQILIDIHPKGSNSDCFVMRLDEALEGDGEFIELVYKSCINYMVRRLINTGKYLKAKYPDNASFIVALRDYTKNHMNITQKEAVSRIVTLVQMCVDEANKSISSNVLTSMRTEARDKDLNCYICGCVLDYGLTRQGQQPEVEHNWPHSLGGPNTKLNLKVSCHNCNKLKTDTIEVSDFHYERISLSSDKDDPDFEHSLRGEYRIAIVAKSGYGCATCGKTPSENGPLSFGRRRKSDSWHFLNIAAFCDEHKPE